jgi:hypothetical protein
MLVSRYPLRSEEQMKTVEVRGFEFNKGKNREISLYSDPSAKVGKSFDRRL